MHAEGGRIALQILHYGRYSRIPECVAPSAIKAPIKAFEPHELTGAEIEEVIDSFATCAVLAQRAGYDGVEIMGSEGYLINEFLAPRTNKRSDEWGGMPDNRRRFAVEIVRRTRSAVGADFIIIYRLSMADLVEDGQTWDEVVAVGQDVAQAGATIINTGIGWHESRVPTIATSVPRAALPESRRASDRCCQSIDATRKVFTVDPRSRATVAPVALPAAVERRELFL